MTTDDTTDHAATGQQGEESDEQRRRRAIDLAFAGDPRRFEAFRDALRAALPPTIGVVLRGSAITGARWADGSPFDADGPGTSDLDLALVGSDALKLWKDDAFYIPALHTRPLCDEEPDIAPPLAPLRRALQKMAGRPVNMQGTADLVLFVRDVLFDQPYLTLLDKADAADEGAGGR
ncbi:MAG: hypothetical protein ACJ79S_13465 [Gemmatimonadaceae bacterium]